MDREAGRGEGAGGGGLQALDAKLTIFALANGLDLKRTPTRRRLEWHRDRLERGILLEEGADGLVAVSALCWNHGDAGSLRKETRREGLTVEATVRDLSAILQDSLDAANAL